MPSTGPTPGASNNAGGSKLFASTEFSKMYTSKASLVRRIESAGKRPHARLPWEAVWSFKRPPQDVVADLRAEEEAKLNAERDTAQNLIAASHSAARRAQQNASTAVHNLVWETDREAQRLSNETYQNSLETFTNISSMRQKHWEELAKQNSTMTGHRESCEDNRQTIEIRAEEVTENAEKRIEQIRKEEEEAVRAARAQADKAISDAQARCKEIEKESRTAELASQCRVSAAAEACAREIADLETREQLWTEEAAARAQAAQNKSAEATAQKLKELDNIRCSHAQRRAGLEQKFEEERAKFKSVHQDADTAANTNLSKLRSSAREFEAILDKINAEVRSSSELQKTFVPILTVLENVKLAMRTRGVAKGNWNLS